MRASAATRHSRRFQPTRSGLTTLGRVCSSAATPQRAPKRCPLEDVLLRFLCWSMHPPPSFPCRSIAPTGRMQLRVSLHLQLLNRPLCRMLVMPGANAVIDTGVTATADKYSGVFSVEIREVPTGTHGT
eukprot:GHVU01211522.1.p1 GENE.GHVU01211522.1~~GHVU01211522.1.p1  ORF type:complete len:129 (-),score=3.22 GHVU01211522.1:1423-1809(-)